MASGSTSGTFQEDYICGCMGIDEPLSPGQLGVLEQTVARHFGVHGVHEKAMYDIRPLLDQSIDITVLNEVCIGTGYQPPTSKIMNSKLIAAIRRYNSYHGSIIPASEVTNAHALALYRKSLAVIEGSISETPLATVWRSRDRPTQYGDKLFELLGLYLHKIGLVEEEEPPTSEQ